MTRFFLYPNSSIIHLSRFDRVDAAARCRFDRYPFLRVPVHDITARNSLSKSDAVGFTAGLPPLQGRF
jgi:hypothetical protein